MVFAVTLHFRGQNRLLGVLAWQYDLVGLTRTWFNDNLESENSNLNYNNKNSTKICIGKYELELNITKIY